MSERPSSSIMERIRKILSKTQEAGCTPAEAETAFAMASRLLAEHNLSMDDLRVSGGTTEEEEYIGEGVYETGKWSYVDNLAYNIVKNYFFVEAYFGARNGNQKVLYLFGTAANVATARFTFNALLSSADRLWIRYKHTNKRPGSEGRMFRVGVMKGFSDKLKEERECQKMERDIVSGNSGGTALALVRVEEQLAKKYREKFPKNKTKTHSYSGLKGSQSTLQAGYEAGKSLNINRGLGGSSQKGIGR